MEAETKEIVITRAPHFVHHFHGHNIHIFEIDDGKSNKTEWIMVDGQFQFENFMDMIMNATNPWIYYPNMPFDYLELQSTTENTRVFQKGTLTFNYKTGFASYNEIPLLIGGICPQHLAKII